MLGESQADAYRAAYNTARMNDNSIRREASRLTNLMVRKAAPRDKTYRLSEQKGSYLQVQPSGAKYCRYKYRFHEQGRLKEKLLALGTYPAISLKIAHAVYCALLLAFTANADEADDAVARAAMVDEVRFYATLARDSREKALNEDVMRSLGTVERHEFVPTSQRPFAYENRPLPIGHGQTISQPYIVALMTDLIEPGRDHVVLEIGTGSGYQAAILAKLVRHVYSIEIIEALTDEATARLERLGYNNVTTKLGDGYYGWEEHAPFDVIVVTAASSHVPPSLVQQLRPGGRMIIPVGGRFVTQQLLLLEKTDDDEVITRQIAAVRFVPLTRER